MLQRFNVGILPQCRGFWSRSILRASCGLDPQPVDMAFDVFESPEEKEDGLPLIIMHGLFGSKQNWRSIGRSLERKLKSKVFVLDARNHGDSPHTADHSSAHMAADVAHFLYSRNITKANVMGHSMGGRAMMFFAMKYPQLVERGIIVDISPVSIPRDFFKSNKIFAAMKSLSISAEASLNQGRLIIGKQLETIVGSKEADFIIMNLRKRENGEFYWACNVESLHQNLRVFSEFMPYVSHLAPFSGPIMFICGTKSNFVEFHLQKFKFSKTSEGVYGYHLSTQSNLFKYSVILYKNSKTPTEKCMVLYQIWGLNYN